MSSTSAGASRPRRKRVSTKTSYDACRTCRKRKVRCDGARPLCLRCRQAGLECAGYTTWAIDTSVLFAGERFPIRSADHLPVVTPSEESDALSRHSGGTSELDDGSLHQEIVLVPRSASMARVAAEEYGTLTRLPRSSGLSNKVMEDVQVFSQFMDAYTRPGGMLHQVLSDLFNAFPSSDCVHQAVSALSWSHASSIETHNMQALTQSRVYYSQALKAVAVKLDAIRRGRDANEHPNALTTSINLLGLYRDSAPLMADGLRSAWQVHLRGVQEFVKTQKPNLLIHGEFFPSVLFMSYTINVARRRAGSLGPESCWNLSKTSTLGGVPIHEWFPAVMRLPGLLEAADTILAAGRRKTDRNLVLSLAQRLDRLRDSTLSWIRTHIVIEVIEPGDQIFDPEIEEHQLLARDQIFPTQVRIQHTHRPWYMFLVMSQLTCLIADCALLRLQSRFPVNDFLWSTAVPRDVKADALLLASAMCQNIYSIAKIQVPAYLGTLQVISESAGAFFRDFGVVRQYEFCQACRVATETRLARLHKTQPRSLCRGLDMAPLLAASARYTQRHGPGGYIHEHQRSMTEYDRGSR